MNKSKCNGKTCGTTRLSISGKYVCSHNNFGVLYPELAKLWHASNKLTAYDYLPHSAQKMTWICLDDPCGCHVYQSTIDNKTRGNGCPFCHGKILCPHKNLEVSHPHLKDQWHPDNPPMTTFATNSHKKVLWKCTKPNVCDCHIWETCISDRTRKTPSGCPYCAGHLTCKHNNLAVHFPDLALEWHRDNPPIENYQVNSHYKALWKCKMNPCQCHIWSTAISDRTREDKRCNCPFCSNKKLCPHNNLKAVHPELIPEWHHENKSMDLYSPGSSDIVKWICPINPCGCHEWEAVIADRTGVVKHGCSYCTHQSFCIHYNLETEFPELISQWHPNNEKKMHEYGPFSSKKALWICSHKHVWLTEICNRTGKIKSGCPNCACKQYSKVQIKWLTEVEVNESIVIDHACNANGEYKIQTVGKVDGYCRKTNTVYEFHGTFWHGDPRVYKREDVNKVNKKTYGELYDKTIARENKIKELGYNLVVMWELDYTFGR